MSEQLIIARPAPRVPHSQGNSGATYKPSIEAQPPIINDTHGALEDVSCLIERLRALMNQNIDEMQEAVIDRPVADEFQAKWINDVWMIFRLAAEKLEEIETIVSAIVEAGLAPKQGPVARHLQIMRSRQWRQCVDLLNAANTSGDMSDEAIELAGRLFSQAMRHRVTNLDEFREKLEIMCSNACFNEAHADELFCDLEALGARTRRAVAA